MRDAFTTAAALAGGVVAAGLLSQFQRSLLIEEAPFTAEELRRHLRNHTLVHIGGHHRSGTTLLWGALEGHPAVGDQRSHAREHASGRGASTAAS